MLEIKIVDNEIIELSPMQVGDKFVGFCCQGWEYETRWSGDNVSWFGYCDNPGCPNEWVSVHLIDDFYDFLDPGDMDPEEVNAILKKAGYDPDELGKKMQAVADHALANSPYASVDAEQRSLAIKNLGK